MMGDINWVLFRSVAYLRGKGVSFGGLLSPPQMIAEKVYSIGVSPIRTGQEAAQDEDLGIFKDKSLDHIYVGPLVETLQDIPEILREVSRKLKIGGHLILHTRIGHKVPGVTELWPTQLEAILGECGKWKRKLSHEQDAQSLQIYKKLEGPKGSQIYRFPWGGGFAKIS